MSANPQYDGVITLEPRLNVPQPAPPEVPALIELPPPPPAYLPVQTAQRQRPRWLVPSPIAAVGLIASAMLGYLLYTTTTKLAVTRQPLTGPRVPLTNRQQ